MENTASWVDEKYGKLLAKCHRESSNEKTEGVDYSSRYITEARKDDRYLFERKGLSNGFGVKKPVIRVYLLGMDNGGEVIISFLEYTLDGKNIRTKTSKSMVDEGGMIHHDTRTFLVMKLTYHAHSRLFERLRTNSREDVMMVLKILTRYAESRRRYKEDCTIRIPSVGRFELASFSGKFGSKLGHGWIIKTFIGEKP